MKKKATASSNTKIAIVFFIFLAFIIVVSVVLKTIAVIRASRFDDSKRFTVSVANPQKIDIISFDLNSKNIAIFKLEGNIRSIDAGKLLGVPIDGYIAQESINLEQKPSSLFVSAILNYVRLKTNLTIIDIAKLAMVAKSIPDSSIDIREVGRTTDIFKLDSTVGRLVSDSYIEKDQKTIQIVNATNVSGLGNRLARLLTHMGGNVIIVATADRPQKDSVISFLGKKSYTVKRLQKMLGYTAILNKNNAIADITIIIGEDKVSCLPF